MWFLYSRNAVGNRFSNQFVSFSVALALGEISLNSAMLSFPLRLVVLADQQARVGKVFMGRHLEVVGGGLVLEHAAGQVERRTVARAKEPARPVVGQRSLRAGSEAIARRAPQVRADADDDKVFGFDRTAF